MIKIVAPLLALLLTACLKHEDKPIHFYRLTAEPVSNKPFPANIPDGIIGLGPIHIPEYLKRPQMLVATTDNQFKLAEHHRWAERLDENISLALFKTLPSQLGTNRLMRYPWAHRQVMDYQIGIDILEFHIAANGQSHLSAQWFIKRKDKTTIDKRSDYQFPASTSDYDVMVKAQSQCLSKLSEEIAKTLLQNP